MAYAFNNDKSRASVPGFFGGRELNRTDSVVAQYTVLHDSYLELLVADGSNADVSVSFKPPGSNSFYSIDYSLRSAGSSASDIARNIFPVPVKAGTIVKFSGGSAFVVEHEMIY